MGWGMTIKDVYVYNLHKADIDSKIEELEWYLRSYEQDLAIMAAQSPREIKDSNGYIVDWEDHVSAKLREIIDNYKEYHALLTLLYQAKESEVEDD